MQQADDVMSCLKTSTMRIANHWSPFMLDLPLNSRDVGESYIPWDPKAVGHDVLPVLCHHSHPHYPRATTVPYQCGRD